MTRTVPLLCGEECPDIDDCFAYHEGNICVWELTEVVATHSPFDTSKESEVET